MRRLIACAILGVVGLGSPSSANGQDPFADEVISYQIGTNGGFGEELLPAIVLGAPRGAGLTQGSSDVLALGGGGSIVLRFDSPVICDGPGDDFTVFENAFHSGSPTGPLFDELAYVEVSQDGVTFIEFPFDMATAAGLAGQAPVLSAPDNGIDPTDPSVSGGDTFDLADVGLAWASYVRLTDVDGAIADVGDLAPFLPPPNAGFDLDALAVVNGCDPVSSSPTPSATASPTSTDSPTSTPPPTATPSFTASASATATATQIPPTTTPSATRSSTATATQIPPTITPSATASFTAPATATEIPPTTTPSATGTATFSPTPTATSAPATETRTATAAHTSTATATTSPTSTSTASPSASPTVPWPTASATNTATSEPTSTATATAPPASDTPSPSRTSTPIDPTDTPLPTATATVTATRTATEIATASPSATVFSTPSPTSTASPAPETATPSATATLTARNTPTSTAPPTFTEVPATATAPPSLPGDLDGDGLVGTGDENQLIEELFDGDGDSVGMASGGEIASDERADANLDDFINAADLVELQYLQSP